MLHVVTTVFNPWRYNSRIKLYRDFEKYVNDSGAKLTTIELAFGDRPFAVTDQEDRTDIQLRTSHELWHKERSLNLAIQRLPPDWKYVAWIDADVVFTRPDWVNETVQLLQHYPVIQMFGQAVDLGPNHEILKVHDGMIYSYEHDKMKTGVGKYESYHPGFAWAMRRDCYNDLGGLLDISILGSGDRTMSMSFVGKGSLSYPKDVSDGYKEQLELWIQRANKHVNRNVGYMKSSLIHHWHGKKADRRYNDRWKILVNNQYDPEFDIKFDAQGLYQYTDRKPQLAYDIRNYFRGRNEDSIDI